jgi:hypothetical protein
MELLKGIQMQAKRIKHRREITHKVSREFIQEMIAAHPCERCGAVLYTSGAAHDIELYGEEKLVEEGNYTANAAAAMARSLTNTTYASLVNNRELTIPYNISTSSTTRKISP